MHMERIDRLESILRGVKAAKKNFYMGAWIDYEHDATDDGETCGTACCAMGYLALDPIARSEGLHLDVTATFPGATYGSRVEEHFVPESVIDFNARVKGSLECDAYPVYGGRTHMQAAAAYLNISDNAAYYLFDPQAYPKNWGKVAPDDVLERLEEVRSLGGAAPEWFNPDRDYSFEQDEEEE